MGNIQPSIDSAEHIGTNSTGDNVEAKRVANYVWDGSNWQRETSSAVPSAVVSFVTSVSTAGTRVQLASHAIQGGVLQAPSTNTGIVYIGGSSVSSTAYGAELQPGQSVGIGVNNTNLIYIDAATNGDKVAFLGS